MAVPSKKFQPWPGQDENGIDIAQLKNNLELTPSQRLEQHNRALQTVLELKRAIKIARPPRLVPGA